MITSRELFMDFLKPGGTSGLDAWVEGREVLLESLFESLFVGASSNSLSLFNIFFSSLVSPSTLVISKSEFSFWLNLFFSWNALCCSFLINSKEAERASYRSSNQNLKQQGKKKTFSRGIEEITSSLSFLFSSILTWTLHRTKSFIIIRVMRTYSQVRYCLYIS